MEDGAPERSPGDHDLGRPGTRARQHGLLGLGPRDRTVALQGVQPLGLGEHRARGRGAFADGGTTPAEAEAVSGEQELARPEDFWDIVLGTGYRATVDAMTADQRQALRVRVIDGVRADRIQSVRTDVIHASALR